MTGKTVYYSGRVQGVGFRYTAYRVAKDYDVTGYVRNLPDGRVELQVEGEQQTVAAFLDALADAMLGNIRNVQMNDCPPIGSFSGFQVRH